MRRRASLLIHRGQGPVHYDLIVADGARCVALQLRHNHGKWQALWLAPHRRRYLAYSGPISNGRGAVRNVWRGYLQVRRLDSASHELIGAFENDTNVAVRGERVVLAGLPPRMPR